MADGTAATEDAPDPFVVELTRRADLIADHQSADVLIYRGDIKRGYDDRVLHVTDQRVRRTNLVFLLCTYGGDADAAFRIARCLQQRYKRISVYVHGYCKSAGTLIALGAHELILSDLAELGPLDVQVPHAEELGVRSSGLTPVQALSTLRERTYEHFLRSLTDLRRDLQLPTKLAAQISSEMAVGVFVPIFAQVDPIRLGEIDRAVRIAIEYGNRLGDVSKNLKENALNRLVGAYPSHSFVIDREEATGLFNQVRRPNDDEDALASFISSAMRTPPTGDDVEPQILYLNSPPSVPAQPGVISDGQSNASGRDQAASGSGSPEGGRVKQDGQDLSAGSRSASPPITNGSGTVSSGG